MTQSGRQQCGGFTLVEALVAFVVLALLMIAVQRAAVVSVDGVRRADARIRAEMVARTLMTGPLGAGPDATAPKRGRMNGLNWSLQFQPLNLPLAVAPAAQAKAPWVPMRMTIRVSGETSTTGVLTVETVRLVDLVAQ